MNRRTHPPSMRHNLLAWWTIVILILLGTGLCALRYRSVHSAGLPAEGSVWRLDYTVTLESRGPGGRLIVGVPVESAHCRIIRQELVHPGMRTALSMADKAQRMELLCTATRAGPLRFSAQYDLQFSTTSHPAFFVNTTPLDTASRAKALRKEPWMLGDAGPRLLERLRGTQAMKKSALVDRIFEHCHGQIILSEGTERRPIETVLRGGVANPADVARAMVALCRHARIPARLVVGFELGRGLSARPHTWMEAYVSKAWIPYDPVNGYARQLPARFVTVRRDSAAIVTAGKGIRALAAEYSLTALPAQAGRPTSNARGWQGLFDLTRLPLGLRWTLSVVLLLPLGALLTAFFRNVIGLQTFGTFTPSLLALSFVYVNWQAGLLLLGSVLVVGFVSRAFLEHLKLLMVPRLGAILTVVVLITVLVISVAENRWGATNPRAALLPLVIMTMLVERFTITADEDGMSFAARLMLQTVVVAVFCFFILSWRSLGRVLLAYPESHCFTLAGLVWIGRYAGYRLTELWRFRDLAGGRGRSAACGSDGKEVSP